MNESFDKINSFLKHLTYNCKYSLIEKAEENEDLIAIAQKRGYILPSFDLAPFKCIYAMIDKENNNGCTLPNEEISELALSTLIGKPINFDHVQNKIVGHWIEAKVEENAIVAYGLFFKSALKEDYNLIKELMEKGNLKISYEAHINRLYTSSSDKKHYVAKDVEFAGGALLILTKPAVNEASVLELANTRVLEFASIMKEPGTYLEYNKINEQSRFQSYDMDAIQRMISQCSCPTCEKEGMTDLDALDFENASAAVKCYNCGAKFNIDLKPKPTLIKKGTIPPVNYSGVAVAEKAMEEYSMEELMKKLKEGLSPEMASVLDQYTVKIKEEVSAEVASLNTKLAEKDSLLESANSLVETMKAESTEAKTKIEAMALEVSQKIVAAKELATKIAGLKVELGDLVKDFKEEDFANDAKIDLVRKDKEIASLKLELENKVKESASKVEGLPAGKVTEKASEKKRDPVFEMASRIDEQLYGKR